MQSSSVQSADDENSQGVDNVVVQIPSAQKRVELGLSPRRPTAKSVT